jgi:SAM-dependent methyltransferase
MAEAPERDYVLGTHDEEIARLGLQHEVWRPRALEAWRAAGIGAGQTVLDLGCGPGFAAVDLAGQVGPSGRVIAVDRSRRFLDWLAAECARRGLAQVETVACDLDREPLPAVRADAAWARWVFSFVERPRELLARVAGALRPGGRFVAHEYLDYRTWRAAPRDAGIEELVAAVMASWRARGGEPDIALALPAWLGELGFELVHLRPIVEIAAPGSPHWTWLDRFATVGLERLVELGDVSRARAAELAAARTACAARPDVHMVTPAVLEIVAIRT